ncbi:MAG: class I tRNA ligase family protein, partial [bacterium]|nr:class I tRNA ligase family protein [bacterium]
MKLFNSLTQSLEEFTPLRKNKVTIYVCGITPYDTTHLGHAFTYISFDILIRYLKFRGFQVLYTQNVTDMNDRDHDILDRAKEQHVSWRNLADYWTEKFLVDMHALNWVHPNHFVKASRHIHHMIDLIQQLLDKELAYRRNGSVYLDTAKFPDYGKLSRLKSTEMFKVSRDFEEDLECPEKKHP